VTRVIAGRTRVLVAGNGMTTERLLDDLAARGALARLDVTVIGEESHGAYNRILLAYVLAGAEPDSVVTKPIDWYAEHGVILIRDRRVQRLDTEARVAHIGNGQTVGYDVAVLATGSSAVLPPVAGLGEAGGPRPRGVHVFRSLDDCLELRAETSPTRGPRDVVVVGGGLLGLEAAKALRDLDHRVTIVHPVEHLLNAQLDQTGGALLRRAFEDLGIAVVVGRAQAVLTGSGASGPDRADALLLDSGQVLPADTVVFTTGVRPRIDVAVASGIEVNRGIVVDSCLATSAPNVYAAGECAEHDGVTFGLVAPCWDHAAVIADRLAGTDPDARYHGTATYARLKVAGLDVTSLGVIEPRDDDDVVEILERRRGVYRKLIVRAGRLAGAVLVGDPANAPSLIRMLERGDPVPANPLDIFCSIDAFRGGPADAEILCNCNRVSESQVVGAIEAGHDTVDLVGRATRAGTGCGSCVGALRRVLERETAAAA
jgi:nitrite reductase (NADH) large subunit